MGMNGYQWIFLSNLLILILVFIKSAIESTCINADKWRIFLICNHQVVVRFRAGAPTDVIQPGCRIRGAATVWQLTQASPWQPGCPIQR